MSRGISGIMEETLIFLCLLYSEIGKIRGFGRWVIVVDGQEQVGKGEGTFKVVNGIEASQGSGCRKAYLWRIKTNLLRPAVEEPEPKLNNSSSFGCRRELCAAGAMGLSVRS
jgi:hypothetical protein